MIPAPLDVHTVIYIVEPTARLHGHTDGKGAPQIECTHNISTTSKGLKHSVPSDPLLLRGYFFWRLEPEKVS